MKMQVSGVQVARTVVATVEALSTRLVVSLTDLRTGQYIVTCDVGHVSILTTIPSRCAYKLIEYGVGAPIAHVVEQAICNSLLPQLN